MRFTSFFAVLCLIAFASAAPAKGGSGKSCSTACPFNYDPICAEPDGGSGPKLSFGNECVLTNYNCEHKNAPYARIAKGECPGSTGIRLQ